MDRIHILATGTSRGIGAAIAAGTARWLAPDAPATGSAIDGNGARHVR